MHIAGLIFDDSLHYLDHLAPFCALAGYPLILCEEHLAEVAARFYPDLEVRSIPIWDLELPEMTITCDTKPLLQASFPTQSTQILWLPHGQSDKGWNSPFFEALQDEIALVYGERMVDFMNQKGVFPKTIPVGNFRFDYYCKSLEGVSAEEKTFLYAPTWDDFEKSNSFWKAFPHFAKNIPDDCSLWIKLHPNTVKKFGPEIEILLGKYSKPNIVFVPPDPPIYPLLARAAAYIGDMSSIGYDYLLFNRPMYFLNANPFLPLHNCGAPIEAAQFDFRLSNDALKAQQELYEYTFAKSSHWQKEIDALCSL